jgi:hypothetical protein
MQEINKKKGRQNVRPQGKVRKNRRQRGAKMKRTNCRTVEGRRERYRRNEPSELWRSLGPKGKKTDT